MKKTLFILSMWACTLALQAQDLRTLFTAMPDSLAPLLTKVNREDFIDFIDSHMKAEVKNRFGRPSELKVLTPDFLCLQTTERSSMEMKLLPANDSVQVICVVHTVCGPACDSRIRFYDAQWQELSPSSFLQNPVATDFLLPAPTDDETRADLLRKADMDLIQAQLSADDRTLTFTYTTPDYLGKDDREKLVTYLKPSPLTYEWKEGRFVLSTINE